MSEIQVIKRNGDKDTLDLEKLHKVDFTHVMALTVLVLVK